MNNTNFSSSLGILGFLSPGSSITINISLAHSIGIYEAIVYKCLTTQYFDYAEHNPKGIRDGWFHVTMLGMKKATSLSKNTQINCINNLRKLGLIETASGRRFRVINDIELLNKLICQGEQIANNLQF